MTDDLIMKGDNTPVAIVTTEDMISPGIHEALLRTINLHDVNTKDGVVQYMDIIYLIGNNEIRFSAPTTKQKDGSPGIKARTKLGTHISILLGNGPDADLPDHIDLRKDVIGCGAAINVRYALKNKEKIKAKNGQYVVEVDSIAKRLEAPPKSAGTTPPGQTPPASPELIADEIYKLIGSGIDVKDFEAGLDPLAKKYGEQKVENIARELIKDKKLEVIEKEDLFGTTKRTIKRAT